jgi:hypothetical protein
MNVFSEQRGIIQHVDLPLRQINMLTAMARTIRLAVR